MHELSIASAVFEIVSRHADGRRVARVELQVGHLRQVVPSALEFAWQLLTDGTDLDGSELAISEVAPEGRCRACAVTSVMTEFPLRCGVCGDLDVELTAGEELLVAALEIEDEFATGGVADGY